MKYDIYVVFFDDVKRNKKLKKVIQSVKYFENLNFELAKAVGAKYSCLRPLNKKKEPCLMKDAYNFIGYSKTYYQKDGRVVFCQHRKKRNLFYPNIIKESDIGIYPLNTSFTLSKDIIPEHTFNMLDKLAEDFENNFFDYSLEKSNIWFPNQLIPKGFIKVTSGTVEKGDYYWDDYYNNNEHSFGHFTSVDVSFSKIKPGAEIYESGVLMKGYHPGREENERINYQNEYIIRKM